VRWRRSGSRGHGPFQTRQAFGKSEKRRLTLCELSLAAPDVVWPRPSLLHCLAGGWRVLRSSRGLCRGPQPWPSSRTLEASLHSATPASLSGLLSEGRASNSASWVGSVMTPCASASPMPPPTLAGQSGQGAPGMAAARVFQIKVSGRAAAKGLPLTGLEAEQTPGLRRGRRTRLNGRKLIRENQVAAAAFR